MLKNNKDPYLTMFRTAVGETKIKMINDEINNYYKTMNQIIRISKSWQSKNIIFSSQIIKAGLEGFLTMLTELESRINEEEKQKSLFNETKVYINMLQLLANNL